MIQVFRPIPVERLKLLVFDLDGTLIDSAQDLCNSVNAALKELGYIIPDPTDPRTVSLDPIEYLKTKIASQKERGEDSSEAEKWLTKLTAK